MPYLSWQTVVVGRPAVHTISTDLGAAADRARTAARSADATAALLHDPPHCRHLRSGDGRAEADAILLGLRGETLLARGDKAGAREALEQATTIDPSFNGAHLAVASLYEESQEYDKAVAHYRRMVANSPNDIIGLNNLAFALGARLGKPAEAIYFAERAYELSQGSPVITDTYAWVLHLNGNDQQAVRYATDAAAGAPGIADIHWHYAVILDSVGEKVRAEKALAKALELNPNYKTVPEVQALQKKLSAR